AVNFERDRDRAGAGEFAPSLRFRRCLLLQYAGSKRAPADAHTADKAAAGDASLERFCNLRGFFGIQQTPSFRAPTNSIRKASSELTISKPKLGNKEERLEGEAAPGPNVTPVTDLADNVGSRLGAGRRGPVPHQHRTAPVSQHTRTDSATQTG